MKGKGIPVGSVALIFSAAHLQMRGVAGFMMDMEGEVARIHAAFGGGGMDCHEQPRGARNRYKGRGIRGCRR